MSDATALLSLPRDVSSMLRADREARGITRTQVAAKMGARSRTTVVRIETEKAGSIGNLERYAKALGYTMMVAFVRSERAPRRTPVHPNKADQP